MYEFPVVVARCCTRHRTALVPAILSCIVASLTVAYAAVGSPAAPLESSETAWIAPFVRFTLSPPLLAPARHSAHVQDSNRVSSALSQTCTALRISRRAFSLSSPSPTNPLAHLVVVVRADPHPCSSPKDPHACSTSISDPRILLSPRPSPSRRQLPPLEFRDDGCSRTGSGCRSPRH